VSVCECILILHVCACIVCIVCICIDRQLALLTTQQRQAFCLVEMVYVSVYIYICVSAKSDFVDTYTYIQYIHILSYAHVGKNIHTHALSVCVCIIPLHTCNIHIHFGIHICTGRFTDVDNSLVRPLLPCHKPFELREGTTTRQSPAQGLPQTTPLLSRRGCKWGSNPLSSMNYHQSIVSCPAPNYITRHTRRWKLQDKIDMRIKNIGPKIYGDVKIGTKSG
jgi:hypothetical protein